MDNDKLQGRKDAVAFLSKARPKPTLPPPKAPPKPLELNLDIVVEAIHALAESQPDYAKPLAKIEASLKNVKHEAADLQPLIKALQGLEIVSNVDLSPLAEAVAALQAADLKVLETELKALRRATEKHNDILQKLLDVANTPKRVKYDAEGRITEIGLKK